MESEILRPRVSKEDKDLLEDLARQTGLKVYFGLCTKDAESRDQQEAEYFDELERHALGIGLSPESELAKQEQKTAILGSSRGRYSRPQEKWIV